MLPECTRYCKDVYATKIRINIQIIIIINNEILIFIYDICRYMYIYIG